MIADSSRAAIDTVDANSITVPIGTDETHIQIRLSDFLDGCFDLLGHSLLDERRFGMESTACQFGAFWPGHGISIFREIPLD